METEDFELTKLKLLTLSQQRLQSAQNDRWTQLYELDSLWQPFLEESLSIYGERLKTILARLNQDNEAVIRLVSESQQKLTQTRKNESKKLSQVRQYLK